MLTFAVFEVMDKEPSLLSLAILYGALCIVAWLASWKRWWFGLLLLPVFAIVNNIPEMIDPYVGPAILHEAGRRYVVLSYALLCSALAVTIIGALRQRSAQSQR